MKKYYVIDGKEWVWDTDTLRWYNNGEKLEPATRNNARAEELIDVKLMTWPMILQWLFVEYREHDKWPFFSSFFDDSDMPTINRLESYYHIGKLKVKGRNNAKAA